MAINVTKTYLPDRDKYKEYIDKIFDKGWITNNGPLVQELTERLKEYLGVDYLVLVANGTLALQVAYKAIGLTDEVITTPFSFVATTSSLVWEGIKPIFCDIDRDTMCMDPSLLENLITSHTTGIVPVHVFGNVCDIDSITEIAKRHGIKVVFDAAHAFGVDYKGKSVLSYGDASVLSFHATKLFHTIEGGAIVFKDKEDYERARRLINFGIEGPECITELGINGKMNEFEAAMGLCMLDELEERNDRRKQIWLYYYKTLSNDPGLKVLQLNDKSTYNYAYFPVVFENEEKLLEVKSALESENIYARRYFYPSLNTLDYLEDSPSHSLNISEEISERILCLPIYEGLNKITQEQICHIILDNI